MSSTLYTQLFRFFLLVGILITTTETFAQTDSIATQSKAAITNLKNTADTLLITPKAHSPRRAIMLAALLPGTGQIYNKKYWKVPLVYVGFGIIGYFIYDNNRNYNYFLQAWTAKYNGGANNGPYILDQFYSDRLATSRWNSIEVLKRGKDFWRRNLEVSVLSAIAFYALQIIDANVDAHLKGFDWNKENLSLKFEPIIENSYAGLGFRLRW